MPCMLENRAGPVMEKLNSGVQSRVMSATGARTGTNMCDMFVHVWPYGGAIKSICNRVIRKMKSTTRSFQRTDLGLDT